MHSSSIYISSKTALGNLENFLEAARGKTIVIEDKYRKSTGSIRFGVQENNGNSSARAEDITQTREALYQAIKTVLTAQKRIDQLSVLTNLVKSSGNSDALFSTGTTQLQPTVLRALFQVDSTLTFEPPVYRLGDKRDVAGSTFAPAKYVVDSNLTPDKYLSLPSSIKDLPTPEQLANKARSGNITKDKNNPQFAKLFVTEFTENNGPDGMYTLEEINGDKKKCHTLEEFAKFVGTGDENSFENGANLVTVLSQVTSQNLPMFLIYAILKSPDTPIKSAIGEPIFFINKFKHAFHLKKREDGGIMLTYKGKCEPGKIFNSPDQKGASIELQKPGLVTIECDIIFRPKGDIEYGNFRSHAEGLGR